MERSKSHNIAKSYETEEYQWLLQESGAVLVIAAAAARSSEHQACQYTEQWWDFYAACLRDGQGCVRIALVLFRNAVKLSRKRHGYSVAYASYI